MTRRQSIGLTKAARSARANAEKFKATRGAALAQLKKAYKAFVSARAKLERVLEALPGKMEPADAAIAKLEELSAEGLTGSSSSVLADGVEHVTQSASEGLDELEQEFVTLLNAIKEARRSNV